jgi:O-antigen/teichoic acid export membrane protein
MLQGQRRFAAFGLTRSLYALSRLAAGLALVSLGGGALGAVAALPAGAFLALLGGLFFLGPSVWKPGPALSGQLLKDGLRLSAGALVAYAAYMSLLNNDLLWVNRSFSSVLAGSYATAVLLRRVLILLPGAVVVIMYPRVVAKVAQGSLPDRLLFRTAAVITLSIGLLAGLYFAYGEALVDLAFGPGYAAAGPLLGWLGLGMLGYSLSSVWMNFYLATRPAPYVVLLAVVAGLQNVLLARYHASLAQVTAVFSGTGWLLVLGGLLLYLLWLRPGIIRTNVIRNQEAGA